MLQVGYSSMLSVALARYRAHRRAVPSRRRDASASVVPRAKSVLFIFLTGGPSHIDTFDMKPDAPAEVRGSFAPIATDVPGIFFCEHLPLLAAHASKLAIARTMYCNPALASHETGTHAMLTGNNELPPGSSLYASRHDWPCLAADWITCVPAHPICPAA